MPLRCLRTRERLPDFAADRLGPTAAGEVKGHLLSCQSCADVFGELLVHELANGTAPLFTPPSTPSFRWYDRYMREGSTDETSAKPVREEVRAGNTQVREGTPKWADASRRVLDWLAIPPVWWLGLGAAAATVIVVGGPWLRVYRQRAENNVGVKVAVAQPAAPQDRRGSEPPPTSLPTIAFMTLLPGRTRSARPEQPLLIANGVVTVRLQLNLDQEEYPRYDVSLETPDGRELWKQSGLASARTKTGENSVTVSVPAQSVESGDYVIRLTGISEKGRRESVDDYAFRTLRR